MEPDEQVERLAWGEASEGGRSRRWLRRFGGLVAVLSVIAVSVSGVSGLVLVRKADASLTRVPVPGLEAVDPSARPSTFLLVGSDSRAGLSEADRKELSLGNFTGQQGDTIIYVAISEDRSAVTLVSIPRDLLMFDEDGRPRKATDLFARGPDVLLRAIRQNLGLPVNHFAMVSLGAFIDIVATLGTVEVCLDDRLVDRKSGADFTAGCHDMGPREALAFVRSRSGPRADFARIDRQQHFIRAVLAGLVDRRLLTDPVRVARLVDDVASNLVTDDSLRVADMRAVSGEMLGVVRGGLPMMTLPGYPRTISGAAYVLPYGPGARALLEDLREGRPPAERGTEADRRATTVALLSGGRNAGAQIVQDTLLSSGFRSLGTVSVGTAVTDAGEVTTVLALPGREQQARWVAAVLGAAVEPLPEGVSVPSGADVVIAIGEDATS